MSTQTATLIGLSELDRLEAKEAARTIVKRGFGDEPRFEDYQHSSIGRFPLWFTWLIAGFCVLSLMASFYLSAMNLNSIGRETVAHTHTNGVGMAGIAFVLLAESAVVVFSLAFAIVDDRRSKALLLAGMGMATVIALVGNIEFAAPGAPFQWIAAIFPPVIVLILSFVLKTQALHAIAARHEQKRQWQEALQEWQAQTREPESSPQWLSAYANALKERLIAVNRKGRGRQDRIAIMQAMRGEDWRQLVSKELQAENWYTDATEAPYNPVVTEEVQTPNPFGIAHQNGNGHKMSIMAIAGKLDDVPQE